MSQVAIDSIHPYRDAGVSDEFIHPPESGDFAEVIQPSVIRDFLLAREESFKKMDESFGDEPKPLYYSTESFIDALVSVPKTRAISAALYAETATEYVAMKQFCTHLRGKNIELAQKVCDLMSERDALLSDLRNLCSCKKCRHYLNQDESDLCKDCWVETFPGHPEKTGRTHWEWVGMADNAQSKE